MKGQEDLRALIDGHPGEIPADIVQRGQEIWMVKTCPKHGTFEDLMSSDVDFYRRLEGNFFGRDVKIGKDKLHEHGSSSIRYGRGAVLTVDLTNRCNMMCNPCFMDANQVGYVHELTWDDVKEILDNAASDQAEAAGLGPVLRRRADPLAPLPRGDPLLEGDRLLRRPVRLQRHPLRAGAGVREGRGRGGPPPRLPPVRRGGERAQPAPRRRRTSTTSSSARSRT